MRVRVRGNGTRVFIIMGLDFEDGLGWRTRELTEHFAQLSGTR